MDIDFPDWKDRLSLNTIIAVSFTRCLAKDSSRDSLWDSMVVLCGIFLTYKIGSIARPVKRGYLNLRRYPFHSYYF